MISLRPVDSRNYRECIELSVAPDQQRFVASNLQSHRRNGFAETGAIHGGEIVMERQA